MQKIKLIWDFRGSSDVQKATHYIKHLEEFFEEKNLELLEFGVETINDFHQLAFAVIKKEDVENVKHALKPHRAFLLKS
ncbi:MAG: hypothetical protein P8L23_02360 [Flavobacteriales bacterium]|nr:hypothetical protein [Flavobacteriales bacterium]